MEPQVVRFCAANVTPPIMIEGVPALVCRRCGGEGFADEVVEVFEFVRDGGVRTLPQQPVIRAYDYRWALHALRQQQGVMPENVIDLQTLRSGESTAPTALTTSPLVGDLSATS